MSTYGVLITKLTSRFGIVSRKAAVRLATETGKRIVDTQKTLGRTLNGDEIRNVFKQTLPKRCRPKLITNLEDAKPYFKKLKMSDEMIEAQLKDAAAAAIPNGCGKRPIWVPLANLDDNTQIASFTAHELEHALEINNRAINKLKRRLEFPFLLFKLLTNKNFLKEVQSLATKTFDPQANLQKKFLPQMFEETISGYNATMKGKPEYIKALRNAIEEVIDSGSKTTSKKAYNLSKSVLYIEAPAYKAGGEVERYAHKISKDEFAPQSAVSTVYEDAIGVLREAKMTFLKNKKAGKLQ
jgi:hypothetical protein